VAAATRELHERNEQVVRSYESVITLREATARNQQLAAAGQTLAIVAHQIGTPLNLASGHLQLLQREATESLHAPRLAIVAEQLDQVSAIVRDLLDRIRPRPAARVVDVGGVLRRLADANRLRMSTARVLLDVRIEEPLPGVFADETQVELALLNLISNALDAMPTGGHLTLTAGTSPAGMTIEVVDSGSGIAEELLPRIFEPWMTTKPRGEGTGLGLSITRDVIVALGGSIRVASEHGRGTTCTIELPVANTTAMAS
jgi:signal transduction histidine kinase